MKAPQIKPLLLSQIKALQEQGYELLRGGDAQKANSDFFAVMVRTEGSTRSIKIVCPTFLRGPLGIDQNCRSISY